MSIEQQKLDGHMVTAVEPALARELGYDVDADAEAAMICICGWAAAGSRRRVKLNRWAHLVWARL